MRFVRSAAEQVAPHLQQNDLVILESTSPVGATEQLAGWLAAARPDLQIASPGADSSGAVAVAYCPERVLPGRILQELVDNDRLVGGLTAQCALRAQELYAQVVTATCHMTTARTAELVKLTENAYRDVNIAFANELSIVGDELDVDVADVIALANLHPRVDILQPGPGVGGHCIAVDPWFIVGASREARLIEMARWVNDSKPAWVAGKILERLDALGHDDPIVGLLGMSYKPDVDDLRESPAIEVARLLAETGSVRLKIVEPHVDALPPSLSSSAELVDLDRAIDDCHLIVGLVSHQAFRSSERLQAADPKRRLDFVSLLPG
jgi:UDP-N-acetyl-D-mannosaminuronic acid dehydrogenase